MTFAFVLDVALDEIDLERIRGTLEDVAMPYGSELEDVHLQPRPASQAFPQSTEVEGFIALDSGRRRLQELSAASGMAAALSDLLELCMGDPEESDHFFGVSVLAIVKAPTVVHVVVARPSPPAPPPAAPPKNASPKISGDEDESAPLPPSPPPSPTVPEGRAPPTPPMGPIGTDAVTSEQTSSSAVLVIGSAVLGVAFVILVLVCVPAARKRRQARHRNYLSGSAHGRLSELSQADTTFTRAAVDNGRFEEIEVHDLASPKSLSPEENNARVGERLERARRAKSLKPSGAGGAAAAAPTFFEPRLAGDASPTAATPEADIWVDVSQQAGQGDLRI